MRMVEINLIEMLLNPFKQVTGRLEAHEVHLQIMVDVWEGSGRRRNMSYAEEVHADWLSSILHSKGTDGK